MPLDQVQRLPKGPFLNVSEDVRLLLLASGKTLVTFLNQNGGYEAHAGILQPSKDGFHYPCLVLSITGRKGRLETDVETLTAEAFAVLERLDIYPDTIPKLPFSDCIANDGTSILILAQPGYVEGYMKDLAARGDDVIQPAKEPAALAVAPEKPPEHLTATARPQVPAYA